MANQFIIIGGSLGGLFAALALQQQGFNAQIYERNPQELEGRGAGIVTHPILHEFLQELGLEQSKLGVLLQKRRLYNTTGAVEAEIDFPQILTAWESLYQQLRAKMRPNTYHLNKNLVRFQENDASVTAYFADGSQVEGEALIGVDGFRSFVRQQLFPNTQLLYAGYIAWRGLCEEKNLTQATREALFDYFAFCLPPREQMLGYPVAGKNQNLSIGERRFNYVWYRAAEGSHLQEMLTDKNGERHEVSLPPPLIQPKFHAEMRDAAQNTLSPAFREVVEKSENFFQPIYDLEAPALAQGRVALLGDAAFVVRPHVGAGVTKAALDAKLLAQTCLKSNSIQENLQNYSRVRALEGQKMVQKARDLGEYMARVC